MIYFRGLTERSSIIFDVADQINKRSRMLYKFLHYSLLLIEVIPNKTQRTFGEIFRAF